MQAAQDAQGALFEDALLHAGQEAFEFVQILRSEVEPGLECNKAGPILDGQLVAMVIDSIGPGSRANLASIRPTATIRQ